MVAAFDKWTRLLCAPPLSLCSPGPKYGSLPSRLLTATSPELHLEAKNPRSHSLQDEPNNNRSRTLHFTNSQDSGRESGIEREREGETLTVQRKSQGLDLWQCNSEIFVLYLNVQCSLAPFLGLGVNVKIALLALSRSVPLPSSLRVAFRAAAAAPEEVSVARRTRTAVGPCHDSYAPCSPFPFPVSMRT